MIADPDRDPACFRTLDRIPHRTSMESSFGKPVEVGELNTNEQKDAATRNIIPGQAAAQEEGGPDPAPTIEPGWAEAGERAPVLSPALPVPAISERLRNILPSPLYIGKNIPGRSDAEGGGYHA